MFGGATGRFVPSTVFENELPDVRTSRVSVYAMKFLIASGRAS